MSGQETAEGCERIAAYNERRAAEDPANRDRWLALAASERRMAAKCRAAAIPQGEEGRGE